MTSTAFERIEEIFKFPDDIILINGKTPLPLKFRCNSYNTGFLIYCCDINGIRGYKAKLYVRKICKLSYCEDTVNRILDKPRNLYFKSIDSLSMWMKTYMISDNKYRLQFVGSMSVSNLFQEGSKDEIMLHLEMFVNNLGSILID